MSLLDPGQDQPGAAELAGVIFQAFASDASYRVEPPEPDSDHRSFRVWAHELKPTGPYRVWVTRDLE